MTTNSLQQKLLLVRAMPGHLAALTGYAGRPIAKADLATVEDTRRVRDELRSRREAPRVKRVLAFEDRASPAFAQFFKALHAASSGPVQVWIKTTSDCGLLVIPSIADFNIGFDYTTDPNGVVTLRTADFENELLLDYFEQDGRRLLEVELAGPNWISSIGLLDPARFVADEEYKP